MIDPIALLATIILVVFECSYSVLLYTSWLKLVFKCIAGLGATKLELVYFLETSALFEEVRTVLHFRNVQSLLCESDDPQASRNFLPKLTSC